MKYLVISSSIDTYNQVQYVAIELTAEFLNKIIQIKNKTEELNKILSELEIHSIEIPVGWADSYEMTEKEYTAFNDNIIEGKNADLFLEYSGECNWMNDVAGDYTDRAELFLNYDFKQKVLHFRIIIDYSEFAIPVSIYTETYTFDTFIKKVKEVLKKDLG